MRTRSWVLPLLLAMVGAAGLLVVLRTAAAAPPSSASMFRVVPWPNDTPDTPYHREVEEFLNRMAAEGYRYHSDLAAQPARMMVFEKIAR